MGAPEVAAFVALQLEQLAPFPLDQLYHGHARAADGSAAFVYAAYRRRFPAEQADAWRAAVFVLPDFAAILRRKFAQATVVTLRSATALTALRFEAGKELPAQVAARPLNADAPPDVVAVVRERVLALVGGNAAQTLAYRLTRPPQHRAQGLTFVLEPDGAGAAAETVVPTSECWAMDVRDPEFVAQQRRRLGFDVVLWRVVQGAAAVLALLLLAEIALLAGRGYTTWLASRVTARVATVESIEEKNSLALSLEDFGQRGAQVFDMLGAIETARLGSIVLTSATAEGRNQLLIEGTAASLADYNAYLGALRAAAAVADVQEQEPPRTRETTTFAVNVAFRPEAFGATAPTTTAAVAPEIAGGAR